MFDELDTEIKEILYRYKPALRYLGVDFEREDVQEALAATYEGLEDALQSVIAYWYQLQKEKKSLQYPSACLIAALSERWQPVQWKSEYLHHPDFKSSCVIWWEKAAEVWGESIRNQLIADVIETDEGYEYILFTSGVTLPLRLAQIWGWNRVLNYAQQTIINLSSG